MNYNHPGHQMATGPVFAPSGFIHEFPMKPEQDTVFFDDYSSFIHHHQQINLPPQQQSLGKVEHQKSEDMSTPSLLTNRAIDKNSSTPYTDATNCKKSSTHIKRPMNRYHLGCLPTNSILI